MNIERKITPERELYNLYPRHVAPRMAEKAITRAINRLSQGPEQLYLRERNQKHGVDRDAYAFLREALLCFAASPAGQRAQYTPHPATWFNGSRYLDDPDEWFRLDDRGKLAASEGLRYG